MAPLEDGVDISKYMVHSRTEIRAILGFMKTNKTQVSVSFNDGEDFFLSSVVGITADGSEFMLDAGSDEVMNKRVLRTDKLICDSNQGNVKIHFVLQGVDPTKHEGHSAFLANVPESLVRLQRREFLRLTPPVVNPLKCEIPIQDADGSTRFITATVADISAGGLSLVLPPDEPQFETDMLLAKCCLDLPDIGKVVTTMRVRSVYDMTLANGKVLKRSGCQFIKLPDAMASLIQRYIIQVERDRRARGNR